MEAFISFKIVKDCKLADSIFGKNKRLSSGDWFTIIDSRISKVITYNLHFSEKNERQQIYKYKYEYLIDFNDQCLWIDCTQHSILMAKSVKKTIVKIK